MGPTVQKEATEELHRMVVLQPGEEIVCQIRHHPFGVLIQYVLGCAGLLVAGIFVVLLSDRLNSQTGLSSTSILLYVGFIILTLVLVGLMAAITKVYWGSRWIITTDSLTQIYQNSLFGVRVSELSLENLEDVTVIQSGIFAHMYNFGTLRAETAGERSKFVFNYCPDPHEFARKIIDAREKFVQSPGAARDAAKG